MLRLFVLLVALVPSLALASTEKISSKITDVTVYNDRAKVTRQITTVVPKGASVVTFDGLPAGLLPNSLRVDGASTKAQLEIGSVISSIEDSKDLISEKEKKLNKELEALTDKMRLIKAQKQGLVVRRDFLKSLGKQAALRSNEEIAALELDPDDWANAAKSLQAQIQEVLEAMAGVDIKARELNRDIDLVKAQLARLSSGIKRTYTVKVPLQSSGATPVTLKLSYQVRGASWRPIYDARLSTHDGSLGITQYANVRQQTGENWGGVSLTLSTARPQRGSSLPPIYPLWVDIGNTAVASFGRVDAIPMSEKFSYDESGFKSNKMKAGLRQSIVQSGEFIAASYKIVGASDIPNAPTDTKVMIGKIDMDAVIEIQVAPQISSDAFLSARATLKGDAPLMAGGVRLFVDGAYVGRGHFGMLRPNDESVLFFGADDKVVVDRKVVADVRKNAGIVLRENSLERRFVTKIKNLHTRPVKVVVKEGIPTSRNEKLRVELLADVTATGYTHNDDDIAGLLRWSFDLQPSEQKEIGLGWRLTWPKGMKLSGI